MRPLAPSKATPRGLRVGLLSELMARNKIEVDVPPSMLDILLQTFADLRTAMANVQSEDQRLESSLSTAEQIGVIEDAMLHSTFFGDTTLDPAILARSLVGTLVRRVPEDVSILSKFWHAQAGATAKGPKKRKKGAATDEVEDAPAAALSPEETAFIAGGKTALGKIK